MINTSSAYKNTLYNGHRNFIRKATIYLADNTEISITDADICQGGFRFDSATTSSGSFEIGNIVIEKFTILLNNIYDQFSKYDFYDATIWAYAGLVLDDGSEEWFRKGVYTVKDPDVSNGIITLVCYDNIYKFDIPYTNSKLLYPATRKQIVSDICQVCGVTDNTGEFDGFGEIVETRPENKNLSCRDILSFIAQISGLYGRCDNTGGFKFAWYEKIKYEGSGDVSSSDSLDGGNFTDYSSGDTAYGGNFTDYSSGDTYDGGTFVSSAPSKPNNFHNIYSTASSKPSTDDITITGIKVVTTTVQTVVTETETADPDTGETTTETTSSEETVAFEAVSGSNEYMLVVTDNPLVNDSNAQAIADHLYSKIGGMTFRPMTLSALADPSMEAGDAMVFTDHKGNRYESYITTLSYTIGQYASITCDAESPLSRRKNAETMSPALKNTIEMENALNKKYTRYAQASDHMNQIAANALGFYETVETASNGSKIVYMHDKPKLEDSEIVYKRSIDGFFISRDGGETYTAGFDSNGNAVVNILSAIGINFDWAYGGTLTLGGGGNGNGVLNIVDEDGNPIVIGNKDGLMITKGSISWSNVTGTDNVASKDDIPNDKYITEITKNTITTAYINALDITAKYINVSDKSSIAGWNISGYKVYGGDSNTGVAVMQRPSSETTYVFAAGGTNHDSYQDCPFRVTKDGILYTSKLFVGTDSYTDEAYVDTVWSDNNIHSLVSRGNDGLSSGFGWSGSSTYKTVTKLRGQTVQYVNSSGTTTLSDERMKKDFTDLSKWEEFYCNTEPCAFKYIDGASGRYHIGFKAQQIQNALESSGLTTHDFAGFIQYDVDKLSEEWHGYDIEYGLIYTEFVALNTHMIQQLMKRVALLENEINNLRGMM